MITFVVTLRALPGREAELEAVLGRVRDATLRHEPGVLWYNFGRSADEPGCYAVVEAYRDAAAHAAHMTTSWVEESIPETLRHVDGAVDVRQFVGPGTEPAVRRFAAGVPEPISGR